MKMKRNESEMKANAQHETMSAAAKVA